MNILHILDGLYYAGIEKQAFEIINHFPQKKNHNFLLNLSPQIKDLEEDFYNLFLEKKLEKIEDLIYKSSLVMIYKIFRCPIFI